MHRETSIFARLTALLLVVLAITTAALISAAWFYSNAAADRAFDRLLFGAAFQISEALRVEHGSLTVDLPTSAFELLSLSERDRIFYKVIDTRGKTLAGYADLDLPRRSWSGQTGPVVRDGSYKGTIVRIAAVRRIFSDPSVAGAATIIVAQTKEGRSALAHELTLRATALVVIMSMLSFGAAVFAIRYALVPLRQLERTLLDRDAHDLTPVPTQVPREIKPFVIAINHFINRLEKQMDTMRRFIADAAHQIRTPLTALAAQVEVLSSHEVDSSGRKHLARVQERTSELSRLANQLLSHAMVSHRADAVPFEPLNLNDIVRHVIRDAVPDTLERDLYVSLELPVTPPMVLGDRISIKEAITNLADNAVRHGAPSRITARVLVREDKVDVEIEDDGPGIPQTEWSTVTQRFGSNSDRKGGSGLGFAISADVARAHGGMLSFRRVDGAFAVILSLPRLRR